VAAVDGSSTEWMSRATSAEKPPNVTKRYSHEPQTGDGGRGTGEEVGVRLMRRLTKRSVMGSFL
jgi:hypothetical protein